MLSKTFRKIMNAHGLDVYTSDFTEYRTTANNWLFTWHNNGVVDAHPINCFGCVHLSKPNDLRRMVKRVLNTRGI